MVVNLWAAGACVSCALKDALTRTRVQDLGKETQKFPFQFIFVCGCGCGYGSHQFVITFYHQPAPVKVPAVSFAYFLVFFWNRTGTQEGSNNGSRTHSPANTVQYRIREHNLNKSNLLQFMTLNLFPICNKTKKWQSWQSLVANDCISCVRLKGVESACRFSCS